MLDIPVIVGVFDYLKIFGILEIKQKIALSFG